MSSRPLTTCGGPLVVRGGPVAFLRDPQNIFWSSWQCPTARLQWTEHLWQCAEGRLHFTGASKYFFGARCNGQRPVRNVPRGFGSARNADHTSPKPVDTVSELDALCRRPISISEDRLTRQSPQTSKAGTILCKIGRLGVPCRSEAPPR